jgi:2-haloacid dehalogenase
VAIRQVFFDLNGTLLDPSAMAAPLRDEGGEATAREIIQEAAVLSMAETLTGSYRDFSELLRAAAGRRLSLYGAADRLDEVMKASERMQAFPDAAASIQTLRSAGIGAGGLTNSELEPVIGTDRIQAFKPDPRVYRMALETAGRTAREVALVTAHDWDAIGAKRAGLRVARVSRQEGVRLQLDPEPDFETSDLVSAAREIVATSSGG